VRFTADLQKQFLHIYCNRKS